MNHEFSDISHQLETWYEGDGGEVVFSAIEERVAPLLDVAFGYHALQLGPLGGRSLVAGSRINHRILAGERTDTAVNLVCHCDELPLESDSVDMVVALHTLEFCLNPHDCLREMHRVLTPHGHLLVVSFNPFSMQGAAHRLRGILGNTLWQAQRPVSEHRLTDWLHLVGCQVESFQHLYPLPLLRAGRMRDLSGFLDQWFRRHSLPCGSLYIAHAIKQVPNVRRTTRRLPVRRRLMGLGVAKPAPTPTGLPAARPDEGDIAA